MSRPRGRAASPVGALDRARQAAALSRAILSQSPLWHWDDDGRSGQWASVECSLLAACVEQAILEVAGRHSTNSSIRSLGAESLRWICSAASPGFRDFTDMLGLNREWVSRRVLQWARATDTAIREEERCRAAQTTPIPPSGSSPSTTRTASELPSTT